MNTITINEMAKNLGITARAIRFYEEKGLIAPQKQVNQYRVFTEHDAWRLQTIVSLREIGMPLPEIKKVLAEIAEGDQDSVRYYLELQRSAMFSQLVELNQIIKTTDRMIDSLAKTKTPESIKYLADGLKRLRAARKNWHDRWDFDRIAPSYDQMVTRHNKPFDVHANYEESLDLAVNWVAPQPHEIGLDIGTGTGNLAGLFLSKNAKMVGIDQAIEMLRLCQEKHPTLETKLGNFLAIPCFDHQFDFAVTSFAFHHLTNEQKLLALEEINRVLKASGRICIVDLMFTGEQQRNNYLDELRKDSKFDELNAIEDEYYADRSELIAWFECHGYITRYRQINPLLHILYAQRAG